MNRASSVLETPPARAEKTCRWRKRESATCDSIITSAGHIQCIAWDALNRLTGITRKSDGAELGTYRYDALNRRVYRKADENQDGTSDTERTYVYGGWRVVQERDVASGNVHADYVDGLYIDAHIFSRVDTNGNGDFADPEEQFYYTTNNLYNVVALVDASGNIIERYEYKPYGEATVYTDAGPDSTWFTSDDTVGTLSGNYYTFTGRRSDPESELMYFRNRYYSLGLGRFLGRDSAGRRYGSNLYQYVRSNPYYHVDPLGLEELAYPILALSPSGKWQKWLGGFSIEGALIIGWTGGWVTLSAEDKAEWGLRVFKDGCCCEAIRKRAYCKIDVDEWTLGLSVTADAGTYLNVTVNDAPTGHHLETLEWTFTSNVELNLGFVGFQYEWELGEGTDSSGTISGGLGISIIQWGFYVDADVNKCWYDDDSFETDQNCTMEKVLGTPYEDISFYDPKFAKAEMKCPKSTRPLYLEK